MILNNSWMHVEKWSCDHVSMWLKGFSQPVSVYSELFQNNQIDGKRLSILDHGDLVNMGILKIGDQELLLEAQEILTETCSQLTTTNLQSLAFQAMCKSKYLKCLIKQQLYTERSLISAVLHLISALKNLINWLDCVTFRSLEQFDDLRLQILCISMSITSCFVKSSQVTKIVSDKQSYILAKLEDIIKKGEDLVRNCTEPLICTTATVETVLINKRPDEAWGLQLATSLRGVHTIKKIHENTVCAKAIKIDEGDQILQVNHQTVIGWHLSSVVALLRSRPKEVTLTIKKPPRSWTPITRRNPPLITTNAPLLGDDIKQNTFPKTGSKHGSNEDSGSGGPTIMSISGHSVLSADSSGGYDEVFDLTSPSPSRDEWDETEEGPWGASKERRQTVSGSKPTPQLRPEILVTDNWTGEQRIEPPVSKRKSAIRPEGFGAFHIVKSTPDLRTPELAYKPPPGEGNPSDEHFQE